MDKFFSPQSFANPAPLDDELAHDPGNSPHWPVPHLGYALTGSVDAPVYQPAQLAYPESSQRTIVSHNAYLYYDQVREAPHSVSLSAPQQLSRETYELGQGFYPYDYTTFQPLTGSGTYGSADASARDEGMQFLPTSHGTRRFTPYFPT